MTRTAIILKDGRNILVNHPIDLDDNDVGDSDSRLRAISGSFYMNNPPRFTATDLIEIILDDGWHGNVRLSNIKRVSTGYFVMFASPNRFDEDEI